MNLTKEDLNQIRQIVKEEIAIEIHPLRVEIEKIKEDISILKEEVGSLREEIKIQTSNLRNTMETRLEKMEAQMMLNNNAVVEMKSEIIGIYKYLNHNFTVYDRLEKPYRRNITPPDKQVSRKS